MLATAGQKEEWYANFPERRKAELPRKTLPRTPVNRTGRRSRIFCTCGTNQA
jgi:hypothetical protein